MKRFLMILAYGTSMVLVLLFTMSASSRIALASGSNTASKGYTASDRRYVAISDKIMDLQYEIHYLQKQLDNISQTSALLPKTGSYGIVPFRQVAGWIDIKVKAIKPYKDGTKVWVSFTNTYSRNIKEIDGTFRVSYPYVLAGLKAKIPPQPVRFVLRGSFSSGSTVTKSFVVHGIMPKEIGLIHIGNLWASR